MVVLLVIFHTHTLSKEFNNFCEINLGSLVVHIINDSDSLSSPKLLEFLCTDSLPGWYARDIVKVVCSDTLCRLARLRLFWNIKGEYLRFEVPEGDPLTKLDHVPFTKSDYERLDQILRDNLSPFRNVKEKDLTIASLDKKATDDKVDGYTGATTPSLREYAIKGAVYTCYALWHTVYGTTSEKIKQIENNKVSKEYISRLFSREDDLFTSYAIALVQEHPKYDSVFIETIIPLVKSTNEQVSFQALNYFTKEQLSVPVIQKQLVQIFSLISYQRKFELLWKLAEVPSVEDEIILVLLHLFEDQQINSSLLGYVYKLIHSYNLKNPLIIEKLNDFSKHENLYVRNITQKVLLKATK